MSLWNPLLLGYLSQVPPIPSHSVCGGLFLFCFSEACLSLFFCFRRLQPRASRATGCAACCLNRADRLHLLFPGCPSLYFVILFWAIMKKLTKSIIIVLGGGGLELNVWCDACHFVYLLYKWDPSTGIQYNIWIEH